MHVTVGHIISKTSDFKLCDGCGAVNWHENDECHSCGVRAFTLLSGAFADALWPSTDESDPEIDV